MTAPSTHYDTLGLARTATAQDIRRRYRELAFKYHPDRNPGQREAHEQFLKLAEAYQALGDETRRAAYDLSLRDLERRAMGMPPPTGWQPVDPRGTAAQVSQAQVARQARVQQDIERKHHEIGRRLEEARLSYSRGHLGDARRICQAILLEYRSGPAHEMLGDIFARQRRDEEALHHYTLAAQLMPASSLVMAKLDRVYARLHGGGSGRDVRASSTRTLPSAKLASGLLRSFVGTAATTFFMIWVPLLARDPLQLPLVPGWSLGLLLALMLSGLAAGATMTSACWVRRFDQEMFPPMSSSGRSPMPIGVILASFGMVFLPLALFVYLVIAYFQEAPSPSILAAFGMSFFLTLCFVYAASPGDQLYTGLYGGNIVFPALLTGWFVGDFFRPRWAQ